MSFTNFKNKKHSLDGHSFSSKLEASIYSLIKTNQRVELVQVQDHIYLTDARILFIPDFKIKNLETGEFEWIEAKGIETDVYRIKRRLWKVYGPGRLEIWKGSHQRPFLHETIIPKAI